MKLRTKLTVILLSLLMLLCTVTVAQAVTEGDFQYTVSNGEATITRYTGKATELTIPTTLGGVPVCQIANAAFRDCVALTSVIIPDSVTSLGKNAFAGCTSLTSITIPSSVGFIGDYAFKGCTSLPSIILPDSLTAINWYVFDGCTSLAALTIPESVTSIGKNAFANCTSLAAITIPDAVSVIGKDAFFGCTSLSAVNTTSNAALQYQWPNNVSIGAFDNSFSYIPVDDASYRLTSYTGNASVVIVPSTYNGKPVTQIDSHAFDKSVTLFVTGETPFISCSPCWRYTVNADGTYCITGANISDTRLIIPSEACGTTITTIGDCAFDGMEISFVYIPDSIVTVGANPFTNCTKLTTIVVTPEHPHLYVSADGALYSKADKRLVCFPAGVMADRLTIPQGVCHIDAYALYQVQAAEIILPDTLTDIGRSAFAQNRNLMAITLPEGISQIPPQAFEGCTSLMTVSFPSSLISIGTRAFCGCDMLLHLSLPTSLEMIDHQAFSACSNMRQITIPASVTQIGMDAFTGAPLLTLYVQPGSYAASYARVNMLHALYPDSDSWLAE